MTFAHIEGVQPLDYLVEACHEAKNGPAVDFMDWFIDAARSNFAAFVSLVHRPRFSHSAFSARVCREIDKFVDDVKAGKNPVLMLTAPPQHGKSSLISRCLAPYLYGRLTGHLPAVRIANATYAMPLARRNATDAKSIMLEPIYRAIFADVSLIGFKGNQNTASDFDVPLGGQFKAVGIGGPLTGFSVDVGIVDDATKNAEEALSPTVQDGIEAWFDSVLMTRLQQKSGLVIIGTPWSANDFLARVKRKFAGMASFTLLSFPALNVPGEPGYNADLPEGALVPALHSVDKLLATKRVLSEMWWAALYQQVPLAEIGAIFPRANLQHYRRADLAQQRFQRVIMSVDATFKDGQASDYVAIGVWAKTADDRVWLLGRRRERLAFLATATAIADLKRLFPSVQRMYIEEAANGAALLDMLRKHYPQIEGIPPQGSKEARAHAVSWVWTNNCVMLPHPDDEPGIMEWITEITTFPDSPTGHDDTVDCMTLALHQLCLRTPISALITQSILNKA